MTIHAKCGSKNYPHCPIEGLLGILRGRGLWCRARNISLLNAWKLSIGGLRGQNI